MSISIAYEKRSTCSTGAFPRVAAVRAARLLNPLASPLRRTTRRLIRRVRPAAPDANRTLAPSRRGLPLQPEPGRAGSRTGVREDNVEP